MTRCAKWGGLLIILITVIPWQAGSAQNLDALLEAVDKIEISLAEMVEREAATRDKQIAELKNAIAGLEGSTATTTGVSEEQLVEVMTELMALRVEVSGLKRSLNKNAKQLASIDPDSWVSPGASDDQVEAVSNKLDGLSEKLNELIDHQPKPEKAKSGPTVNGKIYSHGLMDVSDGADGPDTFDEFALSRVYVTLRSNISDHAAVRVTTDFKTTAAKYQIILKYVYLDWKPGFTGGLATIRFGLQPTLYIDYLNKFWARRYISKTVGDEHKFLTSSDLGVSAMVGFGSESKFGFSSLALINGTSYTDVQELNSNKDINFVTLVKPLANVASLAKSVFIAQLYSGTQNHDLSDLIVIDTSTSPDDSTFTDVSASDWKRQIVSFGGLIAFRKTFDLGFDLNWTTVGKGPDHDAVKKSGLSFFGTFQLYDLAHSSKFWSSVNFFGRLDLYEPDDKIADNRETAALFGIEIKPTKGLSLALNFRTTSFEDKAASSNTVMWLNTQFKF